jgi:hypothetical protein
MDADKKKRLTQLLGMMGSAHDGEILNAARLAQRLIGGEGMTWDEVLADGNSHISQDDMQRLFDAGYKKGVADTTAVMAKNRPPQPGRTWVSFARNLRDVYNDDLSDWEQGFVESFIERGWANPTPKQQKVFERIAGKLDLECPA